MCSNDLCGKRGQSARQTVKLIKGCRGQLVPLGEQQITLDPHGELTAQITLDPHGNRAAEKRRGSEGSQSEKHGSIGSREQERRGGKPTGQMKRGRA